MGSSPSLNSDDDKKSHVASSENKHNYPDPVNLSIGDFNLFQMGDDGQKAEQEWPDDSKPAQQDDNQSDHNSAHQQRLYEQNEIAGSSKRQFNQENEIEMSALDNSSNNENKHNGNSAQPRH